MIELIIFDLGNVVFEVSFDHVFEYWARASGRSAESIKRKFIFDNDFDLFEKNAILPEDFRKRVSARLGLEIDDACFDEGWCSLYLEPFQGINELLGGLAKNYRLAALTNTNCIHEKVWRVRYASLLNHFEKIYSSVDMGFRKPEREIYSRVLTHLGVEPAHTLFLDDNAVNTIGAEDMGITSILVTSQKQMYEDLETLGIKW